MNNTLKTFLLLGVLTSLLIVIGRAVGGQSGLWFMLFFSLLMNFFAYFFSDRIALFSARARPLDEKKYAAVYQLVEEITSRAELPRPRLYLSPNPQPNAFATGRNPQHAAIVVTQGLLRNLDRTELKGVLAHETAHIKNHDILISSLAAVLAGTITSLASVLRWGAIFGNNDDNRNPLAELVIIILAPLASLIIQLAVSRAREFKADQAGAKLAGDPNGLASALEKIEKIARRTPSLRINPAFENLYIINPLGGGTVIGVIEKLFSTHPPVEERVAKLREWRY